MLSAIVLNDIMLSVIIPIVITLCAAILSVSVLSVIKINDSLYSVRHHT